MRFDSVMGDAFGPFKGEELEFGPRFTVVHGLNESGKSSWAAALYASLAGRRRSRGRGARDDVLFRSRHKPWSGSRWQVTARLTTDEGARLAVAQNLAKGTTTILDLDTRGVVSASELERRFGIPPSTSDDIDVGQLFGLSRGTLRATTFVPQAEVLRVVDQADELQQFLQRAASTQAVDVTASEVLDQLREEFSTRVGSPSVGSRPLRAATQSLQAAEDVAYRLRTARDEFRQLSSQAHQLREDEERARTELGTLERAEGWVELDQLTDRIERIQSFDAELGPLADLEPPADVDVQERVRAARAAYLNLAEPLKAPEGPTAAELERQIAQLPSVPPGDTAPDTAVRDLWEELGRCISALTSLAKSPADTEVSAPNISSDELRRLADKLRQPRPVWDSVEDERESTLRSEHEQARQQYAEALASWERETAHYEASVSEYNRRREQYASDLAEYQQEVARRSASPVVAAPPERTRSARMADRRSGRGAGAWQVALGTLATVGGVWLLLVEPVVGLAVLVVGLALVGWGLVARTRPAMTTTTDSGGAAVQDLPALEAPSPPPLPQQAPGPRPVEPVLSPHVRDIQERRRRWNEESAAWDTSRDRLRSVLADRDLPTDPDELWALARKSDEQEGARQAAADQKTAADRLRVTANETAHQLFTALSARGEKVEALTGASEADAAFREYERRCQERAAMAKAASRKQDLQHALAARRSEESAFATAESHRRAVCLSLVSLSTSLGLDAQDDPELACSMSLAWLNAQQQLEEQHQRKSSILALREQLLGGSTLQALTTQAEELRARLGPRPDIPLPTELPDLLTSSAHRVEELATRRAAVEGRLDFLRSEEDDLAAAIEAVSLRQHELASVRDLRDTLMLAIEHLEVAQGEAHRSLAPVLEAAMRARIARVTDGRYVDVRVDPESLSVELRENRGAWRDAQFLSQGTAEQTYLLLRLALVEHLDTRETMPLVLDDVTVQCDAGRTVSLLELLADVSAQRQVILFSQESGVLRWARERLDENNGDRLVTL